MESSTKYKIMSAVGLFVSIVTLSPTMNSIDNLHGHTTQAAIWLVIFLMGLVVAWVSVMSPVYQKPGAREQRQAKIQLKKEDEKGSKSNLWAGILVLFLALFFAFIVPSHTFGSVGNILLWFLLVVCGIVVIVFSRPKKSQLLDDKFKKNSSFYLIWGVITLILSFIFFAVGSFGTFLGVLAIIFGIIFIILYFVFKAKGE